MKKILNALIKQTYPAMESICINNEALQIYAPVRRTQKITHENSINTLVYTRVSFVALCELDTEGG